MTRTQTARLRGVGVSMDYRGVPLETGSPPSTVRALVEPISGTDGDYELNAFEREGSRLAILRHELPAGVVIGTVFTDTAARVTHRVAEIYDHPTDILVRLVCESAPLP